MKKVFFSLAVLCSVALVSCGGKKAEEAQDSVTESIEVTVDESVVAPADSMVEAAPVADSAAVADSAK